MATISDARSIHATLTTTTVDQANLTQFWDQVQITNRDGTNALWVRFDGVDPVAEAEGAYIIPINATKIFTISANQLGIPGSTTAATVCHPVKVLGNGGSYDIEGIAGK